MSELDSNPYEPPTSPNPGNRKPGRPRFLVASLVGLGLLSYMLAIYMAPVEHRFSVQTATVVFAAFGVLAFFLGYRAARP
ncbi:MAG: hypothetical protein KY475_14345 [Planctomycetes bacterium]|nr:hypothetical protein [Planctomycetota bacterium]